MPILAIPTQPDVNALKAAYRPIVLSVKANATSTTLFPAQIEFIASHTINIYAPVPSIIDFLAAGNQIVISGSVHNNATFTINLVSVATVSTSGVIYYSLTVNETVTAEILAYIKIKNANNLLAAPGIVWCDIYFNGSYYKTISKTQYDSVLPNGESNPYNAAYTIVNNGDGTQTVTFTFNTIPNSPAHLTVISLPAAGGDQTGYTGAATSPRQITQPVGSYLYSFTVYWTELSFSTFPIVPASFPCSVWSFDIQDAAQEILTKYLGANGGSQLLAANGLTAAAYCKFRAGDYDTNGFIVSNSTPPVQSTGKTDSIAGGGPASNTFLIVNSVLQHVNNQDLASHLNTFKANTRGPDTWNTAYPLTHRPAKYQLSVTDNDYYPFIYNGNVASIGILRIKYKIKGLNVYKEAETAFTGSLVNGSAYYLPNGPKNLKVLFPSLDWTSFDEYFLELWSTVPSAVLIMTTCANRIIQYSDKSVRLHFLNYLGTYDAVTFNRPITIEHEDTSTDYQKSLSYPLQKTDGNLARFNVISNDTYEIQTLAYKEEDQSWLQELKDSPQIFIEWTGTEGQPDDYLPVVMLTSKIEILRNDLKDFQYQFSVKFKFGNEYQTIRN